jgi:hypothetical protein
MCVRIGEGYVLNVEVMILCIKFLTDISKEIDSNLEEKHFVE